MKKIIGITLSVVLFLALIIVITKFNFFESKAENEDNINMKIKIQIEDYTFIATMENNVATSAFLDLLATPLTISMSDYGGFEKVGDLKTNLPTANRQMTTNEGDIVLYNGNKIVMFYGSNSWSYTKLAKVDNLENWKKALGNKDIIVTFSKEIIK